MRIVESTIVTAVFLAGVVIANHFGAAQDACHPHPAVCHHLNLEN